MTPTDPAALCFADTETDGVHPDRKPWDIALIRREPDGRETTWVAFIEIDLSTADPFGLRVGRFYDRHPRARALTTMCAPYEPDPSANLVTPGDAARAVARFTHGAHIVGAVPNFDTEVFDRLLRQHGLLPGWHYHLVDIETLAVGYLAAKGDPLRPPWKSEDLTEALGVEPTPEDERHTALGDARWAMRVYDAVMT